MSEVDTEIDGAVGIMRIDRPGSLNAFTDRALEGLIEAIEKFDADDDVRAVLFTGSGDRGFCAGVDLQDLSAGNPHALHDTVSRAQRVLKGIRRANLPVVAGVNGAAVGAGMDLALACDVRVLRADATLCQSYADVGLVPGDGGAYLLPRLVGEEVAKDLIFSARRIDGREAYEMGLGTRLIEGDAEDTRAAAMELAREYADGPTVALGKAKGLVNESLDIEMETALEHAIESIVECSTTADHAEGVTAFREGREPDFEGR
ncbi:MAG: enoyl-CoA hydratase/isomerase family protein [Salinirussus sp.]